MKNPGAVLVVLAVLLGTTTPVPLSADIPRGAITWKPDHERKTITVTVKLLLYPSCRVLRAPKFFESRGIGYRNTRCVVTPAIEEAIRDDIAKVWSGHSYKCYKLIFVLDIVIDNNPGEFLPNPPDRVAIMVDQLSSNGNNHVVSAGSPFSSWDSNDPADKVIPTNNPTIPNIVTYPRERGRHTYAHELGHILGLHNGYTTFPTGHRRLEGHPDDVMYSSRNGTPHQSTINRMVRRNGVIPLDDLKCDYKIETNVSWLRHHGVKCGGPGGEWNVFVDGTLDLGGGVRLESSGGFQVQMDGEPFEGTYAGPFEGSYIVHAKGIPMSRGGNEGTIAGNGVYDPAAGTLTLGLHNYTGTFWAENPYASKRGPTSEPPRNRTLPVVHGNFCRYD